MFDFASAFNLPTPLTNAKEIWDLNIGNEPFRLMSEEDYELFKCVSNTTSACRQENTTSNHTNHTNHTNHMNCEIEKEKESENMNCNHITAEKIYYKGNYTTVVWSDGTVTTVKCGENETFDKYSGFAAAVCKKFFGSTTATKRMIRKLDVYENKRRRHEEMEAAKAEVAIKAEKAREAARLKRIKRRAEELMIEDEALKLLTKSLEEKSAEGDA